MSFMFKCPKCSAELEAQDEWEGMESQCPNCQAAIKISKTIRVAAIIPPAPAPDVKEVPPAPTVRGEKFPFICPLCGTFAELNSRLSGKQYTCSACGETVIAAEAKEKDCPFCGEKIKFNASVCRYCQRTMPQYAATKNASQPYNHGTGMGNGMPKSRTTYVLCGVFLGGIGIHDFYAGYTNKGIIKIAITAGLFFLFGPFASGVPSWIWAIIDICTVKADANGTPFMN